MLLALPAQLSRMVFLGSCFYRRASEHDGASTHPSEARTVRRKVIGLSTNFLTSTKEPRKNPQSSKKVGSERALGMV